jgi:hypothetical protein
MADRWIAFVKDDARVILPTNKLQPSISYRSWDGAKMSSNGVLKACSESVRNACVKAGFDDVKTAKITGLVNPLEGEAAKHLQALYAKQVLADLSQDIVKDPNYSKDPSQYPNLQRFLSA